MPTNTRSEYIDVISRMTKRINEADFKIRLTEENKNKKKSIEVNLTALKAVKADLEIAQALYKQSFDDIQDFVAIKRKEATNILNTALRTASNVVVDGEEGLQIKVNDDSAWLETADNRLVQSAEGGGYRGALGVFLRCALLRLNPKVLPFIILDEAVAKLSLEASEIISAYLPVLAQDFQIICIEQKPEVFANVDYEQYNFFLTEEGTVCKKE